MIDEVLMPQWLSAALVAEIVVYRVSWHCMGLLYA
jgi:hypothetical protein